MIKNYGIGAFYKIPEQYSSKLQDQEQEKSEKLGIANRNLKRYENQMSYGFLDKILEQKKNIM